MKYERKYITLEKVSLFLGKSEETIVEMIKSQQISAIKDENGEWIFPIYYSKGIRYVNSRRDPER